LRRRVRGGIYAKPYIARLASDATSPSSVSSITDFDERVWPIGEVARAAGVSVRTLRHYEAVGLLVPVERSDGGRRLYDARAVQRLRRILALRELGFGLQTIAEVLESDSRASLLKASRRQLERVEVELDVARRLRARLAEVVKSLESSAESAPNEAIDEMEVARMGVKLTQIYTGVGDAGETQLADMARVRKTHPVIEAGGAIEELIAKIGELLADGELPAGHLAWVEEACDEANASLDEVDSFVLWFGDSVAAQLDVCRAICRRAERRAFDVEGVNPQIGRYLNRLSDLLFVLARAAAGGKEHLWEPGGGSKLAPR
jgi:cob(I)alamin adenosyltransferase